MNHSVHIDYKQTVEQYLVVLEVDEGDALDGSEQDEEEVGKLPLNMKNYAYWSDMCGRAKKKMIVGLRMSNFTWFDWRSVIRKNSTTKDSFP